MRAASLGTLGRIWSATERHWALAASGVSCAKASAMMAETTRRPYFLAWAKTFRMKCTGGPLNNPSSHVSLQCCFQFALLAQTSVPGCPHSDLASGFRHASEDCGQRGKKEAHQPLEVDGNRFEIGLDLHA